jgi:hypothetical protein
VSPELERALVNEYPRLFVDYGAAPKHSPVAFAFDCGDGWFDLLDILCAQPVVLDLAEDGREVQPLRTMQIKQKYGTLRFYVGPATDEPFALIAFAEALSARGYETFGNKGHIRGTTWLQSLFDPCAEKAGYADELIVETP